MNNKYRIMVFLAMAAATLVALVFLFYMDIIWSWDGYDLLVGERTWEGLALSIITTGFEVVPAVLLLYMAIAQLSRNEKIALVTLMVICYVIDVATNWVALAPREGESWVATSQTAADFLKLLIAIVAAFTEQGIVWTIQAIDILVKQLGKATEETVLRTAWASASD